MSNPTSDLTYLKLIDIMMSSHLTRDELQKLMLEEIESDRKDSQIKEWIKNNISTLCFAHAKKID